MLVVTRHKRVFRILIVVVVAAAWTACYRHKQSDPAAARKGANAAQTAAAASQVTATAAAVQSAPIASNVAAASMPSVPPLTPVSDKQRIYCQRTTCRVGEQSCCSDGELGVCVPTVPPRPGDKVQPLDSQIEACSHATPPVDVNNIARCDESVDCRDGEACCSRGLFGGAGVDLCVPIKNKLQSPCEWHEVCIDDASCRTPGSVCIARTCRKPLAKLPCGDTECTAPRSVCCLEQMRCMPASECHSAALECAHHSDCLKGQSCEISAGGTACTGRIAWGNAGSVCDRDAECGVISDICKKPVCVPSEHRGIKQCDCADNARAR